MKFHSLQVLLALKWVIIILLQDMFCEKSWLIGMYPSWCLPMSVIVSHVPVCGLFQISQPCLPCTSICDQADCMPSCHGGEAQVIHFYLTHLTLEPRLSSNDTLLQAYFVSVRAVTGSGQSVTMSSAGVYIDTTPPVIETVFHIDYSWSKTEPSHFQGDNSTIAVYYEAVDKESEVIYQVYGCDSTSNYI